MERVIFPAGIPRKQRTARPQPLKNVTWGSRFPKDPIPLWLLKKMAELHGVEPVLIVKDKVLKETDLAPSQGRLFLPPSQVLTKSFLNGVELAILDSHPVVGVGAAFIGINSQRFNLELRKWVNGLVLTIGWKQVIASKLYKVGDKYPLWCFRLRNEDNKLCFALVPESLEEEKWYEDAILLQALPQDHVHVCSPIPDEVKSLADVEEVASYFSDQ
ncbi:unnamed protein product [Microthlaspi erraticum]|uniref:TF-B3 domain-containing protein n=1 Tax=Microthlaspi erraticum TaxID=1685480 RepID=A0A6D2IDS4_9BRAS|nr:unnamed protein product [Microthlaspi erraticum]